MSLLKISRLRVVEFDRWKASHSQILHTENRSGKRLFLSFFFRQFVPVKTKLIAAIKRPTDFALTEMWSRRDLYNQARPNNKTKPLQQEEEFLAVFLLQMDPSTSAKRITFIIRLGNLSPLIPLALKLSYPAIHSLSSASMQIPSGY